MRWIAARISNGSTTASTAGTTFEPVVIWFRADAKLRLVADRGSYDALPMPRALSSADEAPGDTVRFLSNYFSTSRSSTGRRP